jgi:hypothetical protein
MLLWLLREFEQRFLREWELERLETATSLDIREFSLFTSRIADLEGVAGGAHGDGL